MRSRMALLLVFAVCCSTCFAGSGPDAKHIEKVRKQARKYLWNGRTVFVETNDQHKMQGAIVETGPETFVLTVADQPLTLRYADIKTLKDPRSQGLNSWIATAIFTGALGPGGGLLYQLEVRRQEQANH